MSSEARSARERLGLAAIMSVDQAAELLPMEKGAARDWLQHEGLIFELDGRKVVRWGDVYDAVGSRQNRPAPVIEGLKRAGR